MFSNSTFPKTDSLANMTVNANHKPQGWSPLYVLFTTVFFLLITAIGLFGNGLVVATLFRFREMRTPCNLLIGNICAADLAVCVIAAPLRIMEVYCGWIFGDVMCYILAPLQDVFVVVSIITQTIIALERHRAIVSPFTPKASLRRVKTSLCVIWISSYLAAGLPTVIFLKNRLHDRGFYYCLVHFPGKDHRMAYMVYLVLFCMAVPLAVQTAAYLSIIRALRAKRQFPQANRFQWKSFNNRVRRNKHLINMLIVLTLAFQVCSIPRGVIMLIETFGPEMSSTFSVVMMVTLVMFYLRCVINPFILWSMSKDFRAGCLSFSRP